MRRGTKIAIVIVVAVLVLGALMIASMLRRGFSTHDEPGRLEMLVARTARGLAVPADLKNARNPLPLTSEALGEGRAHFADHCAGCHGNDGKGSGIGKQMYPRAPDMTLEATQSLSDGALFAIIENGVRLTGMPGFGSGTAASARSSWELVHFVRHLPEITPAELAEMKRLNPRPPAAHETTRDSRTHDGDADDHHASAPAHVH
jgi:mono/diheme cytochrome c family protein